jgi:two-component system chemotaxis response regulator CheV
MVVDDSTVIRTKVTSTFTQAGYNVVSATSGRDAWDKLTALKNEAAGQGVSITEKLHLIITDIEMPEMDGHALTRRVKEDTALKVLPVVLFSSLITEAMRQKGHAVGADDQVAKPDLPELTKRIRSIIKTKLGL